MSTTSGPIVPGRTGNSRVLPSGSFSVAIFSAMVVLLVGPSLWSAQVRYDVPQPRVVLVAAPGDDVPQLVIGQIQQRIERRHVLILQCGDDPLQNEVELEQPAPAFPLQPVE